MKLIKTFTCAIAASAAVALSASTSHAVSPIGVVTNYDTVTFNLTVKTDVIKANGASNGGSNYTQTIVSQKLATKDVLTLLSSQDFANMSFPSGAMLAFGWDLGPWESHLLVIDKSGNIYYDVTASNTVNENFTLEIADLLGAESGTAKTGNPGGESITAYNTGYINILDRPNGTNALLNLYGYGPSTEKYSINWDKNGATTSWSSSFNFTPQGADQTINGTNFATMSGTITLSGHGKTTPYSLNIGSFGQAP
jgi:hypothetical protein